MKRLRWLCLFMVCLLPLGTSLASDCEEQASDTLRIGLVAGGSSVTTSVSGSTVTVTAVTAGTATISVTATDTEDAESAAQTFVVTVCGTPGIVQAIPAQTLLLGASAEIDLDDYFSNPNSGNLSYTTARTGVQLTLNVSADRTLMIEPDVVGTATVIVTAENGCGNTEEQSFDVTVRGTPVANGTIADRTLRTNGASASFDVAPYFTEPDGDALAYSVSVDYPVEARIPDIVTASMNGSTLTLRPRSTPDKITIIVTADDVDGSASQSFVLTVTPAPNQVPIIVGTIPDRTLQESGSSEDIGVSTYFSDPEGQAMTYAASSGATSVATTSTSGSTVTVTPKDAGTATISVTATDTESAESAAQTFVVTVCGTPGIVQAIPAQALLLGASAEIDLDDYFSNPNSGSLSYTTARTGVMLTLDVSADRVLMIEPDVVGTATVTVTAENGCGNTEEQSFDVTVRGTPVANGTIADRTLRVNGASTSFDVAPYFSEPDGDALAYSVSVDYPAEERIPDIVTASMSGSTLTLRPLSTPDKITIIVTAADADGSASQSFVLTVTGAP